MPACSTADRFDRDRQQSIDYDPFDLMPAGLPPHPRVLVTPTTLARTRELLRNTRWTQCALDRLVNVAAKAEQSPAVLPSEPDATINGAALTFAHRNALLALITDDDRAFDVAVDLALRVADAAERWPKPVGPIDDAWGVGGGLAESRFISAMGEVYDMLAARGLDDDSDQRLRRMLITSRESSRRSQHLTCGNHATHSLLAAISVGVALGDTQLIHDALYGCVCPAGWRYGLVHQLRHDWLADGTHWERTPGYHFYTLYMMTDIAWILRNIGVDIWHKPMPTLDRNEGQDIHRDYGPTREITLKAAFDVPFFQTYGNGEFSLLHDSGLTSIRQVWIWSSMYELAYETYRDPKYAWLLQHIEASYPAAHPDRKVAGLPMSLQVYQGEYNFARLQMAEYPEGAFDPNEDCRISATGRHEHGSTLLPEKGEAILRSNAADPNAPAAYLFFGPLSAGHQCPAALHLDIHADAHRITVVPRSGGYSDRMHLEWFNTTVAHNTVTVDERSMFPCDQESDSIWEADVWRERASDGELVAFDAERDWRFIRAVNRNVYPGVCLDRSVLIDATCLIDVYRVTADREHQFDWTMHLAGDVTSSHRGKPIDMGSRRGYSKLREPKCVSRTDAIEHIKVRHRDETATVSIAAPHEAKIILAQPPISKRQSLTRESDRYAARSALMVRQIGREAVFVSLWSFAKPGATSFKLKHVDADPTGDVVVDMSHGSNAHQWVFPSDGTPRRT